MNEEEYVSLRLGHQTPFTTPEGYFEELTGHVMSRVPMEVAQDGKKRPRALLRQLRPWLYAAVFAGVVGISATLYYSRPMADDAPAEGLALSDGDAYIDEVADYAMVDNQDIYAYLLADI